MVVRRPVFVGAARLVAFPDHLADRRQTPWSGKRQMVRKRDQTGPSHGQRRTKGGGRSSQALLVPSGPILAEISQPNAPRDPRTLAMVQCATRHFEQIPAEGGQPYFAFLTQFFIYVQFGSDRWDFHIFVQIDDLQIDI